MKRRPGLTERGFDEWAERLGDWVRESVSPFANDSPQRRAERIARGRGDKIFFMKTYLPHYFHADFAEFHAEWAALGNARDECIFVAAPREHAKSTFFTFGDPLHDICYGLRRFILIISDANDQATGFVLPIRAELEENPRIRHDFGNLRGPLWTRSDFTTAGATGSEAIHGDADYTATPPTSEIRAPISVRVLGRGRGEKVRGLKHRQHRPDKAIVDDFENDMNVQNPRLVKAGKDWLTRAIIGSLGAGFCFVMVGNIFHPRSILAQFMAEEDEEGKPLYTSRVYRAIVEEGGEGERPLWPAAWPMERLLGKRRSMGSIAFNAEMMNRTVAEDSPFREEWLRYYDREGAGLPPMQVATFVDPSAGSGEASDFKAIVTVGLEREKMVFRVLHAWIRRASPGEMFAAAYNQFERYGGRIGIEENMLKDFLHEAIHAYARERGKYLPWEAVHHSTNKEARIIGGLSHLVEHGKLLFERKQSDQAALVEQLLYILNANVHDDGPDALEGAVGMLQGAAGKPAEYEGLCKRRLTERRGAY
ncbi:MAG: phage terminase large subunit [Syntrophobacteraceae bacterium]